MGLVIEIPSGKVGVLLLVEGLSIISQNGRPVGVHVLSKFVLPVLEGAA
jgi:hypothetical protein